MKSGVSIIVPAYNEERLLRATLRSIKEAAATLPFQIELIVVDNNSTDATASIAKEEGVALVFEPVNQIARARNAGAKAASGDFLLFIDADTHAPAALIGKSVSMLKDGSLCGGGALISFDAPLPFIAWAFTLMWNSMSPFLRLAGGSFVFCRRDAFAEVGGFNESLYAGEDVSISMRLRKWGRKHGMGFMVLSPPVVTSARKLKVYSQWSIVRHLICFSLFPWRMRSKEACSVWYERRQ